MKSTITFSAAVALPAGGTIAVQADDVPIAGADLFDLIGMMFEQAEEAEAGAGHERQTAPPAPKAPTPLPTPAPKAAPKAAPKPDGRPKVTGGTCSHAILTAIADAGGTIRATAAQIGADYGTGKDTANRKAASVLVLNGLLTTTPRTGPTSLTAKGWAAIGRTAPTAPKPPSPLAAVPDTPKVPDLGPIEKRPFDPDAIRNQQAAGMPY